MGNSATPPSGGLASNSNYLLNSNDGSELKNVLVTIDVTQALIGNIGFSFQLNAYSKSPDTSAWRIDEISLPDSRALSIRIFKKSGVPQ